MFSPYFMIKKMEDKTQYMVIQITYDDNLQWFVDWPY
jgi:hypothetical protein